MYIKNRTASGLYKLLISILGLAVLADSASIFDGELHLDIFRMFTTISNFVLTLYLLVAGVRQLLGFEKDQNPFLPKVKHAFMLAISVTCLIAHFLLNHGMVFSNGVFNFNMLVLHYIVPLGAIADWLLFDKKGTMKLYEPPLWTVFPLLYCAYTYIMTLGFNMDAGIGSRYPYAFLDIDANGAVTVIITILILLAFFIGLGYVYVLIDKIMCKKA